jgi:hypothetical protein
MVSALHDRRPGACRSREPVLLHPMKAVLALQMSELDIADWNFAEYRSLPPSP